jgi:hypothetical protein
VVRVLLSTFVGLAILLGFAQTRLYAQEQAQPAAQPQPIAAPQSAAERPPIPDYTQLTIIIQSYLVALSQANLTAIYTVLHALGAPAFKERNPPDKLFQTFASMRDQGVDLTPVILYTPILTREPAYDSQGLLHLVGYYETHPQRVHFDLTLQPVGGVWTLFAISVKTAPPPVTSATPTTAAPPVKVPEIKSRAEKKSTAKNAATKKEPLAGKNGTAQ